MADIAVVGARRQARDARRAAARPRARQPAPLLPPARPGAGPAPAAHRRHRHRAASSSTSGCSPRSAIPTPWPNAPRRGRRRSRGCRPTASPSPRPASARRADAPPTWARRRPASCVHAFATNLRFEDDEFNFVKTRAKVGTSEAFKAPRRALRGRRPAVNPDRRGGARPPRCADGEPRRARRRGRPPHRRPRR